MTEQSPTDGQSVANQSLTLPKSNEMVSLKRRSASLPDKLNSCLGSDQFDTWLSTLGMQQSDDDVSKGPLRVTNATAPSSTAAESIRIVSEPEIKTSYAVATDAKAALFSNPPSCLPTPTAVVSSDEMRPTTSDTDKTVQDEARQRPREKTSSERLAGHGMPRPSKEQGRASTSSSRYSVSDEAANGHNRVDSLMTDTSSSSSSTDRDEARAGAIQMTRRGREDKIRSRKLRDLQKKRHHHHGIDEIVAQPLLADPKPKTQMSLHLTPVVTVAEQMPVPRGRHVKKPANLILRRSSASSFSASPSDRPRAIAVRTSLSAPPATTTTTSSSSKDDLDLVPSVVVTAGRRQYHRQSRHHHHHRSLSPEEGDAANPTHARRASSLKFLPGREDEQHQQQHQHQQLQQLRAHLHQHHQPQAQQLHEQNQRSTASISSSSANNCRDSTSGGSTSSSNGFSHYYFPHSTSTGATNSQRVSNYTLQTPSAMSIGGSSVVVGVPPTNNSNARISVGSSHATHFEGRGSGGGGGNSSREAAAGKQHLEARIEALERQNRLLEAALQAVLKTGGMLNRCPCSSSSSAVSVGGTPLSSSSPRPNAVANATRSSSAEEGAQEVSALEVYLETRMGA